MSIWSITAIVVGLIIAPMILLGLRWYRRANERKQVRGAFAQYLSPALVEQLAEEPESLELGGEIRQMTFMFCGITQFREIARRYKSDLVGLSVLVNRFNTKMADEVLRRNGTIDKFIADKIMSFWNAPLEDDNHPANACMAALAMIDALSELNDELASEVSESDEAALQFDIRIGLETGPCLIGNLGSEQRFDYSGLGEPPEIASDLEKLARTYSVTILIGQGTKEAAPEFAALEIDTVQLEGFDEPTRIFALLGDSDVRDSPEFRELEARQAAYLEAYRTNDRTTARERLDRCRIAADGHWKLSGLLDYYEQRLV